MRFYFEGSFNKEKRKEGKLASVGITPDTNSRRGNRIFVLVANEINEPLSGEQYSIGLVGENKTPMIFPAKPHDIKDKRILVMGDMPQPGHREDNYLDNERSTGKVIRESEGGGAWGSGAVFIAILNERERVVSSNLEVWENQNGELYKTKFDTLTEYQIQYEKPDVELI